MFLSLAAVFLLAAPTSATTVAGFSDKFADVNGVRLHYAPLVSLAR